MKPFVSLIVPVRNEKTHIHRRLESIIHQNYDPHFFEILVIDGASTDGTREIIEKFQRRHENITLLDNPRGIVPISLNLGLQRAKGEIIIRVDGHASITPDYISACLSILRRTENCSFGVLLASFPTLHLSYGMGFLVGLIKFRRRWGEKLARIKLAPIQSHVPEYTV